VENSDLVVSFLDKISAKEYTLPAKVLSRGTKRIGVSFHKEAIVKDKEVSLEYTFPMLSKEQYGGRL
jgi:hypothetical protein